MLVSQKQIPSRVARFLMEVRVDVIPQLAFLAPGQVILTVVQNGSIPRDLIISGGMGLFDESLDTDRLEGNGATLDTFRVNEAVYNLSQDEMAIKFTPLCLIDSDDLEERTALIVGVLRKSGWSTTEDSKGWEKRLSAYQHKKKEAKHGA